MNNTKIIIVEDNYADPPFRAAHGFALWIESDGLKILLDTGAGENIFHNLELLALDLSQVDYVVLSHGHSDHTGGLATVISKAPRAKVVYHPGVFYERFSVRAGNVSKISIPLESAPALYSLPQSRRLEVVSPTPLSAHVWVTGEVPRTNDFEDTGGPFFLDEKGERPDALMDDLAVWIETPQGIVLCTGCCHSGIGNLLNYVRGLRPLNKMCSVLGGLHLKNATPVRLQKTLAILQQIPLDQLVLCHCTGESQTEILLASLGSRASRGKVGLTFIF